MDKSSLRIELKRKRKEHFAFSSTLSAIITEKVIRHPKYISSNKVGIYVSLKDEVNTIDLIQSALKDKEVYVPKIIDDHMIMVHIDSLDELHPGSFHVLEPVGTTDVKDLDLMITPLLGYDENHYRLGYGKGYYDRYFSRHPYMYKIGLAFSYQKVKNTCSNSLDIPLDEIITEAS